MRLGRTGGGDALGGPGERPAVGGRSPAGCQAAPGPAGAGDLAGPGTATGPRRPGLLRTPPGPRPGRRPAVHRGGRPPGDVSRTRHRVHRRPRHRPGQRGERRRTGQRPPAAGPRTGTRRPAGPRPAGGATGRTGGSAVRALPRRTQAARVGQGRGAGEGASARGLAGVAQDRVPGPPRRPRDHPGRGHRRGPPPTCRAAGGHAGSRRPHRGASGRRVVGRRRVARRRRHVPVPGGIRRGAGPVRSDGVSVGASWAGPRVRRGRPGAGGAEGHAGRRSAGRRDRRPGPVPVRGLLPRPCPVRERRRPQRGTAGRAVSLVRRRGQAAGGAVPELPHPDPRRPAGVPGAPAACARTDGVPADGAPGRDRCAVAGRDGRVRTGHPGDGRARTIGAALRCPRRAGLHRQS